MREFKNFAERDTLVQELRKLQDHTLGILEDTQALDYLDDEEVTFCNYAESMIDSIEVLINFYGG